MEQLRKHRQEWADVFNNVLQSYEGVTGHSSQVSSTTGSLPRSTPLIDALKSQGLRPKDPILNLLLDALALKFVELETNVEALKQQQRYSIWFAL